MSNAEEVKPVQVKCFVCEEFPSEEEKIEICFCKGIWTSAYIAYHKDCFLSAVGIEIGGKNLDDCFHCNEAVDVKEDFFEIADKKNFIIYHNQCLEKLIGKRYVELILSLKDIDNE